MLKRVIERGQGTIERICELGLLLDEAVARGDLPRALVRRAPRGR